MAEQTDTVVASDNALVGTEAVCALCGCTDTIFDVDCCDGCDRLLARVHNLLYGTDIEAECRTSLALGKYLVANPQL